MTNAWPMLQPSGRFVDGTGGTEKWIRFQKNGFSTRFRPWMLIMVCHHSGFRGSANPGRGSIWDCERLRWEQQPWSQRGLPDCWVDVEIILPSGSGGNSRARWIDFMVKIIDLLLVDCPASHVWRPEGMIFEFPNGKYTTWGVYYSEYVWFFQVVLKQIQVKKRYSKLYHIYIIIYIYISDIHISYIYIYHLCHIPVY